jgi:hypothetical protein
VTIITGLGAGGRSTAAMERQVREANGHLVKPLLLYRMRPNDEENYVDSKQNRALAVEMATRAASELAITRAGGGLMTEERQRGERVYAIKVEGHLDELWCEWFDGLRLMAEGDGTSTLVGPVADQAALHGLLERVRDLGLTLLSVHRVEPG